MEAQKVLQQFTEFANSQGIALGLYNAAVTNLVPDVTNNSLTQPVFLDMIRYCQDMCSHFKQEPSFYPRTFLYFRNRKEYFI
jgi:hypothetical protein